MPNLIPKHKITAELYRSDRTIIYRALRSSDQTRVIIKTLNEEYPSNTDITRFKHEFHITQKMGRDGFVRAYEQIKYGNNLALILEDFHGVSLREYLNQVDLIDLSQSLQLAIELSQAVGYIHQQNVIHKNINPDNILINQETNEVQIIDFGISTELSREQQDVNVTNQLEGSLAYVSPEQTGRMNRDLDYRTDYYSLGVTLYEMLTGTLPFDSEDVIGWIYKHITKIPLLPHKVDPSIPEAVSNIVMKLMAKNMEDRYQSASGIGRDLIECLHQLEQNGSIEPFELGQADISEKFQVPQKLYGREAEVTTLLDVFGKAAQGGLECLLVSGYSGVGKSVLVHEVHKPIVNQKGYFIDGKFDQFQRDVPYSAFVQAFQGLVTQLLTQPDERLVDWKNRLQKALVSNAYIILDLIPEVEKIIGPQSPVQELGPTESQNRFFITFKNFIQVFAQKEHPLVIFLDDLQWSDIPTLKLIEYLLDAPDLGHLLLIGSYRSNEVVAGHPLQNLLEEIEKNKRLQQLILKPLDESHVTRLVADTVHGDLETVTPLSALVFAKTHGNPFFVNSLLKNLYQEGVFNFHQDEGHWAWDLAEIARMDVTDNVVVFMTEYVKKMPAATQKVLQLAACIGNYFDLKTLALIDEQSLANTGRMLLPAIQEGIVMPRSDQYNLVHLQEQDREEFDFGMSYKFQHDKVQQAAYALLGPEKKKELHLNIGRLLQEHTLKKEFEEKLIEMVRHFNEGKELITEISERENLCLLNLRASKKAKRSTAYRASFNYLTIAKELLPENAWGKCYDVCFEIHQAYAEAAYLCAEFEIANKTIEVLLGVAKTKLEKVDIYRIQIIQYTLVGRLEDSIKVGLKALSLFGTNLGLKPNKFAVIKEVIMAEWNLGRRSIHGLIEQPMLEDAEKKITMRILNELALPLYILGNENLLALTILKQVNISLRFGNSPEAAYAYSLYAFLLNGALGKPKKSYEFGKLAITLNQKLDDMEFKCRVFHVYACFVHSWSQHWRTTFPYFEIAMQAGPETGDLLYSGFAANCMLIWNPDFSLNEAIELGDRNLAIVKLSKYQEGIDQGEIFQHYRFNLVGRTNDRFTLSDSIFDENDCLNRMKERKNLNLIAMFFLVKLKIYFLNDAVERALQLIPEADVMAKTFMGAPFAMEYSFYTFMIFAEAYSDMKNKQKRSTLKRMKQEYSKMRKWHDHYPDNSFHLVFIMEAEFARIKNDSQSAISSLEKAIEAATENGFLQYKALANKLLGKLYISLNKKRIAGFYLTDAYYDYQTWGATRVLEFLNEQYGSYIDVGILQSQSRSYQTQTISGTLSLQTRSEGKTLIDMDTVTKAAQAISGEVVLENLLTKLMQTMRENAGAEKAILLLAEGKDNELLIQAKSLAENNIEVLTAEKPEDSSQISLGIVNYVARSLESVVLGEATQQGDFTNDRYIQEYQPKSVLCMPILNQANFVGVLYLENSIASNSFTPDRLKVLQILAAQAAIAIENARLYNSLQESERKFRRLAESNIIGVFFADSHNIIYEANDAFLVMTGYVQADLPLDWRVMTPPELADRDQEALQELSDSGTIESFEKIFICKDGSQVPVLIGAASLSEPRDSAVCFVIDLTERKQSEMAIKRSLKELEIKNSEMERFTYSVSHDLKSPLITIKGFLGILEQDISNNKTDKIKSDLATINSAADNMNQLLHQLLDLSKAVNTATNFAKVSFQSIITGALQNVQGQVEESGALITVNSSLSDIYCDQHRMKEVFQNLIDNAIKYRRKDVVPKVEISCKKKGNLVKFTIADNGIGIDQKYQGKIFDLFERIDQQIPGTGVGLALVKRIIENHNGEIAMKSEGKNKGSAFYFTLPSSPIDTVEPGKKSSQTLSSLASVDA